jgi:hypothetical protein
VNSLWSILIGGVLVPPYTVTSANNFLPSTYKRTGEKPSREKGSSGFCCISAHLYTTEIPSPPNEKVTSVGFSLKVGFSRVKVVSFAFASLPICSCQHYSTWEEEEPNSLSLMGTVKSPKYDKAYCAQCSQSVNGHCHDAPLIASSLTVAIGSCLKFLVGFASRLLIFAFLSFCH